MTKQKICSLFAIIVITISTIGCGNSSTSINSKIGWTGKFVDTSVQGITWLCGGITGITTQDGEFGVCPAGSSVSFSIGNIDIGRVSETSDHIFTPHDLVNASRTASENTSDKNAKINAIAALLLTLDTDGDSSNGITIESTAITAFETAITANGGTITATNVDSVTSAIVSSVSTLTQVSVAIAESHLAETGIEITNGTITQPVQPLDNATN